MEDLLLLLSLDDFVALLFLFAGCVGSVACIKMISHPRMFQTFTSNTTVVQHNINPCMIETYPAAARHPRFRLLIAGRRKYDAEETTTAPFI